MARALAECRTLMRDRGGMSHVVEATEDDSGWTIQFSDPLVTQLKIDYRFTLLLGSGAQIVLEEPFALERDGRTEVVPSGDAPSEVAWALPLFDCRVRSVVAASSGELRVEFDEGAVVTVAVNPHYENWQVVLPDGEQWVGTPGGGIAHFPGR